MADPRLTPNNIGVADECNYRTYLIDASTITYSATTAGGSASINLAVTFSAANTVALAADGDPVIGKLLHVEPNSICRVQVGGVCTLPGGTGATLTLGLPIVGALLSSAKGYIRTPTNGAWSAEQVKARGFIANAAVTTAVEVDFG